MLNQQLQLKQKVFEKTVLSLMLIKQEDKVEVGGSLVKMVRGGRWATQHCPLHKEVGDCCTTLPKGTEHENGAGGFCSFPQEKKRLVT